MTQRNPMNERYQRDDHKGQSRKSAASMKPKTQAASSVRMQPTEKTKAQKKAEKKAARAKQAELDRRYYNPPTAEYKRLRRLWWILLILAIATTALSWIGQAFLPEWAAFAAITLAYVFIIAALYVDFSKIRKVRRAYQAEQEAHKSKERRAAEKKQKAEERAMKEEAAQKYEAAKAAESQKKGLFGRLRPSAVKEEKERVQAAQKAAHESAKQQESTK